ncbi:hypothetical protein GCM10009753_79830 [Streptantibioticus ferralitis]
MSTPDGLLLTQRHQRLDTTARGQHRVSQLERLLGWGSMYGPIGAVPVQLGDVVKTSRALPAWPGRPALCFKGRVTVC